METHESFGLGADVIAGFPGETVEDHRLTVGLVESLPFTSLHVFPYSPRPGTAAPRMGGELVPSEIARRARELRKIGAVKSDQHRLRRDGTLADVVVIRPAGESRPGQGLTSDYLMVVVRDVTLHRGERFEARLKLEGGTMIANRAHEGR